MLGGKEADVNRYAVNDYDGRYMMKITINIMTCTIMEL